VFVKGVCLNECLCIWQWLLFARMLHSAIYTRQLVLLTGPKSVYRHHVTIATSSGFFGSSVGLGCSTGNTCCTLVAPPWVHYAKDCSARGDLRGGLLLLARLASNEIICKEEPAA